MGSPASVVYRFEDHTLDLGRGSLRGRDGDRKLRPKSFATLQHLVANAGRLVPKDELIAAVWPDGVASDDSLVQCIREIRRALGDDAHRVVRTVPGRGYLFDVPVSVLAPRAPSARIGAWSWLRARPGRALAAALLPALVGAGLAWTLPAGPAAPAAPSLVVLPFANLSDDPGQDVLAEAFTEDVTTELSRQPGAVVISRRSATAWRGARVDARSVGRALGVRYVLQGALQAQDGDVRVTVQLVDTGSGVQLWAERYDYRQAARLEAQNLAVARIARTLGLELVAAESRRSERERPVDPHAADLALRARALADRPHTPAIHEAAGRLYEAALARDGDSVPALLGIAGIRIYDVLNRWAPVEEHAARLARAEAALAQALALAPASSTAHRLRGALLRARGDPEQAIAAFGRALELDPNDPQAHAELGRTRLDIGQADRTIGHVERAIALSPRDPLLHFWCFWAGQAALHLGDDEAAIAWLRRAIEANPADETPVAWLAVAYALLGREADARPLLARYLATVPTLSVAEWDSAYPRRHPAVLAQRARIVAALRRLGVPE